MNKPVLPPVSLAGSLGIAVSDGVGAPPRRKRQGLGEEEAPVGEGVIVADGGDAARSGAAALLPGSEAAAGAAAAGGAAAGGAGAAAGAAGAAVGGSFGNAWVWAGVGVAGVGAGVGYYRHRDKETTPVAGNVAVNGGEDDASLTGQGRGSDAEGDALTFSVVGTLPAGVTFHRDGSFAYIPQAADQALDDGEYNTVTFQYVASDGTASSAPATVTLTVNGANDAPVSGGATSAVGTEDAVSIGGSVPAATDVDGEALTYSLTAPAPAGLTFNTDGTFSYVPQAADNALAQGATRTVTFDYKANDGSADSNTATATLTITGSNDAPAITFVATPLTPVPLATEFQVNTTIAADQQGATVAALGDGGFVVVWEDMGTDGSGYGIYGQRFAADGTPAGIEFQANTNTSGNQREPAVTALGDGGFLVTWADNAQDGSGNGVYGQRFAADGALVGAEFRVNTYTDSEQRTPTATTLADGSLVVAWQSRQDGSDEGIYAQRYAQDGSALGSEFRINTETARGQDMPALAALADGGFVATWRSYSQDEPWGNGIYGQRYAADGSPEGTEFRVNTYTTGDQTWPVVAGLTDGGFVVAWQSAAPAGAGYGIFGQRYDAAGVAVGGEFRMDTTTSNPKVTPTLVALADGGFLATWASMFQAGDGDSYGIFGQRFAADGTAAGGEFRVNTTTAGPQSMPAMAPLEDGSVQVVWQSAGQDGSGFGVFGQRLEMANTPEVPTLTEGAATTTASARLAANDPDASDTHAWSITDASDYGTMTIANDGTWTFTLDNSAPATIGLLAGNTVTETFTATVTDSKGATDTHTVNITIAGAGGGYQLGADGVDDSFVASAGGDYLAGLGGRDQLVGQGGVDIFDGGAGDDSYNDLTASDDLYLYREGVDGFDIITESTNAGSDADELRILDASGLLYFSNMSADLLIETGSGPDIAMVLKDFFTYDYTGLSADIELINVYSDSGSTLIASYTSQQIFDLVFP